MALIQKVPSSHAQGLPLGADVSSSVFKSLFLDIGLMQFICGISSDEFLTQKDLLAIYRGGLAEQFVGQQILLYGGSENERLYYWNRPNKSSSAEIDYLLVRNGEILPVEVKSGAPARLKSLSLFLKEHPICKKGLVFYSGNIKSDATYRLKYMPLYTKLDG